MKEKVKKREMGKIEVNIIPTDQTGLNELYDVNINTPEDLLDYRLDFAVVITRAIGLPSNFCRDVYIEYSFYLDD